MNMRSESRRSRDLMKQTGFLNVHLLELLSNLLHRLSFFLRLVGFNFVVLARVVFILLPLLVLSTIERLVFVLAAPSLLLLLVSPLIAFILSSLPSVLSRPIPPLIPFLIPKLLASIYSRTIPLLSLPF